MQQEKTIEEIIEDKVKELSKRSTAPDKETPDWMEADIRRGIKAGIEIQAKKDKEEIERLKGLVKSQFFKYYDDDFQNDLWETFKTENNL